MADDPEAPEPPPSPPEAAPASAASAATAGEPATDASAATAGKPAADAPAATPAAAATVATSAAAAAAAKPAAPAAAAKPAAPHAPPAAAPPSGPTDPPPPADKTPPAFIQSLQSSVAGSVSQISYWVGDWTIIVPVSRLLEVARHLRDAPDALFDFCSDVTASDWPPRAERFDVIYCLYSTVHRHRIRVKVRASDVQPVPSMTEVWPSANWLEREVYDMFGVNFTGHPDRRRILMPEDWQGFPERKDYPLEGPGELLMENPLDWLKLRQAREEADIE